MRILFMYPNILRYPAVPVGFSSIIGTIKDEGHECMLLDFTFIEDTELVKYFVDNVMKYSCDILAIHCTSSDWNLVKILLSILNEMSLIRKIYVVIGGPHPTSCPDEVMEMPLIDTLVIGEGELVIKELVGKLQKNEDLRFIQNCWTRFKGRVYKNNVRPLIHDLDSLALPAFQIFDERHITGYVGKLLQTNQRRINLETSRGCPFACSYCIESRLHAIYDNLVQFCRYKSIDRIIKESKFVKEKLKIGVIQFVDDNFGGSLKRLKELSYRYPKEVGLHITILISADRINEETVQLLANMDIKEIGIGVETGDEIYRRKILNKPISNKQIIKAFKLAKKYGITSIAFYMIGLPFETRESIETSIKFNELLKPDISFVSIFFPFPGTSLYNLTKEKELIFGNYDYLPDFYGESILRFNGINSGVLQNFRRKFSNVVLATNPYPRRNLNLIKGANV